MPAASQQGRGRRLKDLIATLPITTTRSGLDSIRVEHLTDDSRCVRGGSLFIARAGSQCDGRQYIPDAIAAGAVAILTDVSTAAELIDAGVCPQVAMIGTQDIAVTTATLAERFHGNPSRSLTLIGITGTNGKTTTAHLIRHLARHAGIRCGLIGTVCVDDGSVERAAALTTPGAIELSETLAAMMANGCEWCVMEVSSHALTQQRTAGLSFDAAIFTNLSGDHLDYHDTMDGYASAKARLFAQLSPKAHAIVNHDDPAHQRMLEPTRAARRLCSTREPLPDSASVREVSMHGSCVCFTLDGQTMNVQLPLIGMHNVSNALHAAVACEALGMDRQTITAGLSCATAPPGRYEPVSHNGETDGPLVLVDYAHTDHALHNALAGLQPLLADRGRLRVVFGCGGDRDTTKRPRMAQIACDLADDVVITSDNPRSEDPRMIVDAIAVGVPDHMRERVSTIVDRRDAIEHAVRSCGPHDILLIAGKGHEDYQIIGTRKMAFDDRAIARQALEHVGITECVSA